MTSEESKDYGGCKNPQRYFAIAEMREAGHTYRAVGEAFGISSARVRQICAEVERWREGRERALRPPIIPDGHGGMADATSLAAAGLSSRALGRLAVDGLVTVGQVRSATDDDLLCIPNLGRTTLEEIRRKCGGGR